MMVEALASNQTSMDVVRVMHALHGQAWMGRINAATDDDLVIWPWDGKDGSARWADFVLPVVCDEVILRIDGYRRTPIEELLDWTSQLQHIDEAIEKAGGVMLTWF